MGLDDIHNFLWWSKRDWGEQVPLLNWLSFLGIPLYQAHASGHATPHEIKHVIDEISPKRVIPIHTERSELFRGYISDLGFEIEMPYEGGKVEL